MIEFSGVINKKIQGKLMKQTDRKLGCMFLTSVLFFSIITILFSIENEAVDWRFLAPTICLAFITVWLFIAPLSISHFRFHHLWNYYVRIENDFITKKQVNQKENDSMKKVSDIKKVIDNGEYYTLHTGIFNTIFCQKNLLISGTLEEFEALFEGKIKRKKKLIE